MRNRIGPELAHAEHLADPKVLDAVVWFAMHGSGIKYFPPNLRNLPRVIQAMRPLGIAKVIRTKKASPLRKTMTTDH